MRWSFLVFSLLCFYTTAIAAGVDVTQPTFDLKRATGVDVVRPAFEYKLPKGWSVYSEDESATFLNFVFYDADSDVIQMSVSKELDPIKFANAKHNLKQTLAAGNDRKGWKRISGQTIRLPAFEEVDEETFIATAGDLTSAVYNVYGPRRIAIFTVTLKRNDPAITVVARPLIQGLTWKVQ